MSAAVSYDPAAPSTSRAAANADNVKTLQDPDATKKAQKRRRESDGSALAAQNDTSISLPASSSKGKGRAMSFADETFANASVQHQDSPQAGGLSQQDAFKAAKAEAAEEREAANTSKSKNKKKTTAKARYLKAKMARYKARKRMDKHGKSEAGSSVGDRDVDMNDATMEEDGDTTFADTTADISVAMEGADVKRARKKAKREERRAKEAAEAEAAAQASTLAAASEALGEATTAGPSKTDLLEDEAARKAERKAKKAAKRAAAFMAEINDDAEASVTNGDEHGDEQNLLKRDLALIAKAEELKVRQEKANKRAKAKQKYGKSNNDEENKENEEVNAVPTQPDALPRFPKPVQPVAPSQRELDDLLISHDLRHAILVDKTASVPVTEFEQPHHQVKLSQQTVDRLRDMNIEKFFAVQSAVLPVLLENNKLYTTRQRPRDICVSAPTGSGKTLSYVIPVVEVGQVSMINDLIRMLIYLPTDRH